MTDFKVALDIANSRCMVHPDQPLIPTPQQFGPTIMTCPICNAEYFDNLAKQPDVITINSHLKPGVCYCRNQFENSHCAYFKSGKCTR